MSSVASWWYNSFAAAAPAPAPDPYVYRPMEAPYVPPLILDGPNVPSPLDPPPGPTFNERYPAENLFPPMGDSFNDRFHFGSVDANGDPMGSYLRLLHDYDFIA